MSQVSVLKINSILKTLSDRQLFRLYRFLSGKRTPTHKSIRPRIEPETLKHAKLSGIEKTVEGLQAVGINAQLSRLTPPPRNTDRDE